MKKYFLKIKKFFTNKLNIVYHQKGENDSKIVKIPVYITILLFLLIISCLTAGFFVSNYYYTAYRETENEVKKLESVRKENIELTNKIYKLAEKTDKINITVNNIKLKQQEFAEEFAAGKEIELDSEQLKLETVFSYNENLILQGLPIGGSDFRLYYKGTEELINDMQHEIARLKDDISVVEKNERIIKNKAVKVRKEMRTKPSIWPLAASGRISAEFGWRYHPILKRQEFHDGLDIAVNYNTPVISAAEGKVIFAGWSSGYGRLVKVKHSNQYTTYYAHLNKIAVSVGEKVKKGQLIAYSGNSGRSTGPHLHYEIRKNGVPENPRKYVNY
ncbi:MAG: M23 family metallopeptidase [Bacillota bacterium]